VEEEAFGGMVVKACLVGLSGEGTILFRIGIGCDVCRKEWILIVVEEKLGLEIARSMHGWRK
jgi:hypothetical protein